MKSTPAATRPLSALLPLAVWALSAFAGASAAADVRVVDPAGQPVAGVTIEFVDQPIGAFGVVDLPVRRASNAEGVVATADLPRAPLDFRVANAEGDGAATHWAVRFVHGLRTEDSTAGVDLLGIRPIVYDLSADVVCVVEETGTIEISIVGAKADDRFHATFLDQRPEPESHRNVTVSASFTGASGSIRVPSGRGTLYLAQHGFLGAQVLTREGPLMVSVTPGQTSQVTARFLDGPTARLIAPFDAIPFENIQALAPDGETVVADFPFLASPLRIDARFPVTASGARPPSALPSARFPKHLLRAVDVPLQLGAYEDPNAQDVAKRYIDRPPMELIFLIDPGAKLRLPEVTGGWIRQAEGGLAFLSRALYGAHRDTGVSRPALGELRITGTGPGAEWSAQVTVKDPSGKPLPFVEAFVAIPGAMLSRGITGPDGALSITGLRSDSIAVGLVTSVADQTQINRPSAEGDSAKGEISTGRSVVLGGTWQRSPDSSSVGDLLVLVPSSQEEMVRRQQFRTHARPIAFVDAAGNFHFGSVPAGSYTLRAGRASEGAIDLLPDAEGGSGEGSLNSSATLILSGTGDSLTLELKPGK